MPIESTGLIVNRSAVIIISNTTLAEKLRADLTTLGFSEITLFLSIDFISESETISSPDLIIIDLNNENENWLVKAKERIQANFGSNTPILVYDNDDIARTLIKKGILGSFCYVSHSYSLHELELCIKELISLAVQTSGSNTLFNQQGIQSLFNYLPNGVFICDKLGEILEVNKALCNLLGFKQEEICGKNLWDIVHIEKSDLIKEHIDKVLNGKTIRSETFCFSKDGNKKYLILVETQIKLSDGSLGFIAISHDITKGKEIDDVLIESEEKYRILVEKSNDGIIFAQNGKFVYGNPRIIKMLGISTEDFIGKPIETYLHISEKDKVVERYNKRLSGESIPEIYETVVQLSNGESIPVELNVNLAYYRGKYTTIVFIRDISSRKLTEKYLKDSEESYRSVFDNASDAIYIQDQNGIFLDVNKAALQLYGYSKSDIIGNTPELLSAPGKNDLIETNNRVAEAFKGKTQRFEFWGITKNGRVFPKEVALNKGKYFGKDVVFAMARDITERKNAEAVLLESENKFRTLAEQIPVGLYRTSIDGTIYFANPALANILGFDSVDDLVSHNVSELYLNPDERHEILSAARKSDGYIQRELMLIRKDGKKIWIHDNGHATLDNEGRLLYFDGVIENITKQKEASEALKKSEANLRAVLNAIPDLIFRFNRKGVYLDFYSNRMEDLAVSPEVMIGSSIYDFFAEEFGDKVIKSINTCLDTGELQTLEYTTSRNDELNYYEARLVPAGNDEVLSLARNITIRKKAQEKINMLAQTMMNVRDCISITDMQERFMYVNPAFLSTFGYKEEELIGQPVSIIRPNNFSEEISKEIEEKTLAKGWKGELINVRKNGSIFPISLSSATIHDENGNPVAKVGISNDITERKNTESEMINAKERAEESDRLKSAFLANMSHEIRSPMNAILGFIRILRDEEKLSENGKQYVDLISNSGLQLMNVIEDIVDTSKIQANQLRLSYRVFDLNTLLFDIFTIFSSQVQGKSESNTILLPPELSYSSPFLVYSDDLRIRQIITNLLSNALKFTPKGTIEFGYSVIVDDENPLIQIFVRDTGIGLANDKLNLIFERFRQADDSYTRMYGGSGLGLAISKGLIELLGGNIWVESEEGIGSTFFFTIPYKSDPVGRSNLQPVDVNVSKLSRVEGLNWSDKTIFIVEDIKDVQFYLKKVLGITGAYLVFAGSLKEARQKFSEITKVDLVLLDIRLPDGDGYELTHEFKTMRPQTPIIAQTAYALIGEKEKSKTFGCDDFITKPIDADLLLIKIMNFFQK